MSYLRTVSLPNGDTFTKANYYKCDVTGNEIFEADPHYFYGSFHVSEEGVEQILSEYIESFGQKYGCGYPLFISYLMSVFCKPKRRNCFIPKELKEKVLKKYKHQCNTCGDKDNLQFDHIKPVSKGGLTELKNLQILCRRCNIKKSNKYELNG